ncbi:MAG: undecaprenyldiphospho-muramoylpentapeptide beta-N-acetylglucosaminyltransferase [Ignavibacteriaceae bacterium]|nr:undecaprenyldiphospho-muramoylpentapeptide beta-N-acetylglucosaminyltransferase [Ignavibacteriaceae bacterium]
MKQTDSLNILFAGGGTGGHVYPAIALAEEIRCKYPGFKILFIGAKNKIEEKIVPNHGFKLELIEVRGLSRKLNLELLKFPFMLLKAMIQARKICNDFKPDIAIGTGGYVSYPAIKAAKREGSKVYLIEPNSLPGKTTNQLESSAEKIFVQFEDAKKRLKYPEKSIISGNPVRANLSHLSKEEACKKLGIDANMTVVLVLGGSQGAASINNCVENWILHGVPANTVIVRQTGTKDYQSLKKVNHKNVLTFEYIEDMAAAYSAADIVVARAGATTIAELLFTGKPSILIPSPYVAENHQYYNAKSLVDTGAALLIEEKELENKFESTINGLLENTVEFEKIKKTAESAVKKDALKMILAEIFKTEKAEIRK